MTLFKLRLQTADLTAGRAILDRLGELDAPAALAVTLFEQPPSGFVVEAYYDGEPELDPLQSALLPLAPDISPLSLQAIADANWVALSQAALPPIKAGRLVIHGSHDRSRYAMQRHAIEIDAGEAFGTGHNATTAGCLIALDRHVKRRHDVRNVLDLGCGTGVLAIAAARLLPRARVVASDNDPVATAIAEANARLNRVANRVSVVTAHGFSHPALRAPETFDVVLANILPRPLIALMPEAHRALAPGGVVVLSGLLREQAREVRASYCAAGFRLLRHSNLAEWAVLTLRRG